MMPEDLPVGSKERMLAEVDVIQDTLRMLGIVPDAMKGLQDGPVKRVVAALDASGCYGNMMQPGPTKLLQEIKEMFKARLFERGKRAHSRRRSMRRTSKASSGISALIVG
jgi:hypothetical protein